MHTTLGPLRLPGLDSGILLQILGRMVEWGSEVPANPARFSDRSPSVPIHDRTAEWILVSA